MRTWQADVGLTWRPTDRTQLIIADLALARALYAGIPAARMLARMRLASDERDLDSAGPGSNKSGSTWDRTLLRMFGASPTLERIKRAVARQTRAASHEDALRMNEACVAALAFAVAVSSDPDASPAEIFGERPHGDGGEPALARACGRFEPRVASSQSDRRAILFEACVHLTTRASAGPWPSDKTMRAVAELAESELALTLFRPSSAALFPLSFDAEIAPVDRRMVLLERAELDALVAKDPRELASAIARTERARGAATQLDTLIADLATLLGRPGDLILAMAPPEAEANDPAPMPSMRPSSWIPTNWSSPEAIAALADAVEHGATTVPRLKGLIARAGEPALDAIGAEMLRVASHPFASGAFADILARSGRARDVIRLVTYFAITPDPGSAARSLSACNAPELPSVLRAWLEAMLPTDGALVPFGENPETSSAARLTACVASLAPYPRLYGAVRPLLARVSEAPPPAGNSSDGPDAL